jgi:predicted nucleic acid-binding protein
MPARRRRWRAPQLHAAWLLTEEAAARILAASLGLEVHGSLGVVLWAAARGHLSRVEAASAVNRLARSSLWISAGVLAAARAALHRLFASLARWTPYILLPRS